MINEIKVGPQTLNDGATTTARGGRTGAQVVQDAHGRYQEAVMRGNVYRLSAPNIVGTAFVGGAGGTPLISIYNPTGSGKNLIVLGVGIGCRIIGAAVLNTNFSLWAGVSVANTGTLTTPTNVLTNNTGGAVAQGSVNAATTSTTAITLALPIATYMWGTSVGTYMQSGIIDVGGLVVAPPGVLVAFGQSVALTTAAFDSTLIWDEVAA